MKRVLTIVASVIVILIALVSSQSNPVDTSTIQRSSVNKTNYTTEPKLKTKPICDGTIVTSGCVVDNVNYSTYIYHPAVPEKSHIETVTIYEKEIVGYCTLCNDGTYSPSCATGRGACSHHDGVAQWNAPEYRNIPKTSTKTIVDSPAQEAYYEKIIE